MLRPYSLVLGLKRAWRLQSESDVQRVWQHGRSWAHPLLILRARPNGLDQSRVAFVAGKKVGKAVTRNRAKRLMREVIRARFLNIVPGYDLVLIGRSKIAESSLTEVTGAIDQLLTRAKLLK